MTFLRQKKRNLWSTIMTLGFVALIILGAAISIFFQSPISDTNKNINELVLINDSDISNIESLELKNPEGFFQLTRDVKTSTWHLLSNTNKIANKETAEAIINTIRQIKITGIYPYDSINEDHFSMDRPSVEIKIGLTNKKIIPVKIGLINSIDDLTYIAAADRLSIYQTTVLKFPIHKISTADFIEERLLPFNKNLILNISISKNSKKTSTGILKLSKKNNSWINQSNAELKSEMVLALLDELAKIRNNTIIEQKDEAELKRSVNSYKTSTLTIDVEDINGSIFSCSLTGSIPSNLVRGERQVYITKVPREEHSYLIGKGIVESILALTTELNSQNKEALSY